MDLVKILKFFLVFLIVSEARTIFRSTSLRDHNNSNNFGLEIVNVKKRSPKFPRSRSPSGTSKSSSLPTACVQDTDWCPYNDSWTGPPPDLKGSLSLAPYYEWHDRHSGSRPHVVHACCACRFCLNPFDRSKSLKNLSYYAEPIYAYVNNRKKAVGCACTKAKSRGK